MQRRGATLVRSRYDLVRLEHVGERLDSEINLVVDALGSLEVNLLRADRIRLECDSSEQAVHRLADNALSIASVASRRPIVCHGHDFCAHINY